MAIRGRESLRVYIGGTKGGEERHYAEGSVATDIRVRGEV